MIRAEAQRLLGLSREADLVGLQGLYAVARKREHL
jgi:hypothetical protein